MKFFLIKLIQLYSFLISPLLGRNCRFYPTCSCYMVQAIEYHGVIKGLWLGSKRLLKCHPYYKGDINDPVPLYSSHICSEDCTHPRDRV